MNGFEMRQNMRIKEYLKRNSSHAGSTLPIDVLLKKNQHTLVVMTPNEFWDFLVKYYKKKGLRDEDIMLLVALSQLFLMPKPWQYSLTTSNAEATCGASIVFRTMQAAAILF